MDDFTKKSKRKGFLVPLKTKDDAKQIDLSEKPDTPQLFEEKKAVNITPHKNQRKRKEEQKNMKPHTTLSSKTNGQTPQKASKKAKNTGLDLPVPKSLTDKEYDEIFSAILQGTTSADNEEKATNYKETGPAIDVASEDEKKQASQHVQLERKEDSCCREKDDSDSVKSEDVDTWTNSPAHDDSINKDCQQLLKGKSFAQKKAERSGILKPKQLTFSPSLTPQGQGVKNQVERKNKNDMSEIKEKSKQMSDESVHTCGLVRIKKDGREKQGKGLNGPKMSKKKKKETKEFKGTDLLTIQNQQETIDDQDEETGTWIQCSNSVCGKWRYVAGIEDPILVPAEWECKMNPDTEHNACNLPEVDYDESEHISTTFTVGSLVWAKMAGYPWWPGMIEPDPDYDTYFELLTAKSMVPFQYHVTFFDDHVSRAWIRSAFISPYIKGHEQPDNKMSKRCNSYKKEIQQAIANADKATTLSLLERIKAYGFLQRYNKKSKWRVKDNLMVKAKKANKGKKRHKPLRSSPEAQPTSYQDTDDSNDDLGDFSDMFEDSKNPVKTKSRGLKSFAASDSLVKKKEPGSSSIKSNKKEDKSSEDDDENSSQERSSVYSAKLEDVSTCKPSQKTTFDPDIFTQEAESVCVDDHAQCTAGENADLSQTCTDRQKNRSDETKKSSNGSDNGGLFKKEKKISHLSDTENAKLKRIDAACLWDKTAKVNCESRQKKKGGKHSLKLKAINVSEEEKCTTSEVVEDAGTEVPEAKVSNIDCITEHQETKETSFKISKSKEHFKTTCESKKEGKRKKKPETKVKNSTDIDGFSETVPEGFVKNKIVKKSSNAGLLLTESQVLSSKNFKDNDIHTTSGTANQNAGEKCALQSEQDEIEQSKTKRAQEIHCEDESDKENIEPTKELNQSSKTKINQNSAKKGVKRHANTDSNQTSNSDSSFAKKQGKQDRSKAKKTKLSAISDTCLDNDAEAASNTISDNKEEKKQNQKKSNKKKTKSFAAPVKACESSDREVPQIRSTSDGNDNKKKSNANVESRDGSRNTDQHIVPDIAMSMESNNNPDLDIDTEQVPFDDEKISSNITQLIEKNVNKTLDHIKPSNKDDDAEEDDDKLDLDILVQKTDSDMPQKFLSDSDGSDSDEMAELNLEGGSNEAKVKVEEIGDMPQIFGRFAGRCTEHGSDSDPMELIED